MAKTRDKAFWFIADLVEEIHVAKRRRNHVWINLVLITAANSEDAYQKALAIGREGNTSYKNTHGKKVICKFRGIHELIKVQYPLQHGCELFYRSRSLAESGIKRLVRKKNGLMVFGNQDSGFHQE